MPWQQWPTKPIRGQVTQLPTSALSEADQKQINQVDKVLCGEGYLSPELAGQINFGATYDLGNQNPEATRQSHQDNLAKLEALLPIDKGFIDVETCKGRVAMRCTVADYTPIVGPLSSHSGLVEKYAPLRQNAKWLSEESCELIEGLYVNLGHGSRGLFFKASSNQTSLPLKLYELPSTTVGASISTIEKLNLLIVFFR